MLCLPREKDGRGKELGDILGKRSSRKDLLTKRLVSSCGECLDCKALMDEIEWSGEVFPSCLLAKDPLYAFGKPTFP
ncbi:unnamed protein product [Sphenostylis stenocarpa]|uniref:Uncharacterized protein n=1 Tax=Sphenostylis stenocarpa TaxID=92480 RepID=A0AA86VQY1_9FABA|nr:unnamed protein product [Sphenostylis stenocarpa]